MDILREVLLIVFGACFLIGWSWLVWAAFRENYFWGLLSLFLPPWASLKFGLSHYAFYATPTWLLSVGLVVFGGTYLFMPALDLPGYWISEKADYRDRKQLLWISQDGQCQPWGRLDQGELIRRPTEILTRSYPLIPSRNCFQTVIREDDHFLDYEPMKSLFRYSAEPLTPGNFYEVPVFHEVSDLNDPEFVQLKTILDQEMVVDADWRDFQKALLRKDWNYIGSHCHPRTLLDYAKLVEAARTADRRQLLQDLHYTEALTVVRLRLLYRNYLLQRESAERLLMAEIHHGTIDLQKLGVLYLEHVEWENPSPDPVITLTGLRIPIRTSIHRKGEHWYFHPLEIFHQQFFSYAQVRYLSDIDPFTEITKYAREIAPHKDIETMWEPVQ